MPKVSINWKSSDDAPLIFVNNFKQEDAPAGAKSAVIDLPIGKHTLKLVFKSNTIERVLDVSGSAVDYINNTRDRYGYFRILKFEGGIAEVLCSSTLAPKPTKHRITTISAGVKTVNGWPSSLEFNPADAVKVEALVGDDVVGEMWLGASKINTGNPHTNGGYLSFTMMSPFERVARIKFKQQSTNPVLYFKVHYKGVADVVTVPDSSFESIKNTTRISSEEIQVDMGKVDRIVAYNKLNIEVDRISISPIVVIESRGWVGVGRARSQLEMGFRKLVLYGVGVPALSPTIKFVAYNKARTTISHQEDIPQDIWVYTSGVNVATPHTYNSPSIDKSIYSYHMTQKNVRVRQVDFIDVDFSTWTTTAAPNG